MAVVVDLMSVVVDDGSEGGANRPEKVKKGLGTRRGGAALLRVVDNVRPHTSRACTTVGPKPGNPPTLGEFGL